MVAPKTGKRQNRNMTSQSAIENLLSAVTDALLQEEGDQGIIHRLRGQPSNRRLPAELRQQVLAEYRQSYHGFGPTFACEKLAEQGLKVSHDTLRRWLIEEGLWQGQRKREKIGRAHV